MVAHVPAGAKVVIEPVVPGNWAAISDARCPTRPRASVGALADLAHRRARRQPAPVQPAALRAGRPVRAHAPTRLLDRYANAGFCWIVLGSLQAGRAFADPTAAPAAVAYYAALADRSKLTYHVTPFSSGAHPVPFSFDWSIDYYPRQYHRPGPEMSVYRLTGGAAGRLRRPELPGGNLRCRSAVRPTARTPHGCWAGWPAGVRLAANSCRSPISWIKATDDFDLDTDRRHLARAIELAGQGRGHVSPDPLVGAVIGRDAQVIAEGLSPPRRRTRTPRSRRSPPRGTRTWDATMYVSLEPCCHHGRTPPCTDAIRAAGIRRLVVASDDPSKHASGRGLGILRDEGVEVVVVDGELNRARACSTSRSASTPGPAARGCCSSPR